MGGQAVRMQWGGNFVIGQGVLPSRGGVLVLMAVVKEERGEAPVLTINILAERFSKL
jgi:hypothetical protein